MIYLERDRRWVDVVHVQVVAELLNPGCDLVEVHGLLAAVALEDEHPVLVLLHHLEVGSRVVLVLKGEGAFVAKVQMQVEKRKFVGKKNPWGNKLGRERKNSFVFCAASVFFFSLSFFLFLSLFHFFLLPADNGWQGYMFVLPKFTNKSQVMQ